MRSPDGATSNKVKRHLVAAYNSSIDPKGWHAEFAWLVTHSGRFTHISGHPSATGRAQDKESTPAEDRRSTTEPRNQPSQCNSAVYSSLHGTQGCHLVFFDFFNTKNAQKCLSGNPDGTWSVQLFLPGPWRVLLGPCPREPHPGDEAEPEGALKSAKLTKWALALQEYRLTIKYTQHLQFCCSLFVPCVNWRYMSTVLLICSFSLHDYWEIMHCCIFRA